MSGLVYREDMDEVRSRLTQYWQGGDIGRPVMTIYAPRAEPAANIPAMPKPEGWITDYSVSNFDYRVNIAERACLNTWYLGEAVPTVTADLGPSCLALYLGCEGVDEPDTVWFRPCIGDPEKAEFKYDRNNFYWDFTLRLAREQLRVCGGKAMIQYPDLIEGLDTLAAMRGSQTLLVDLLTNPDWIHASLRQITDLYFRYYDVLYDLFRDEVGGSYWWIWAPGRMAKFQCDFSAMIGPEMFEEFMYPVLSEMCERVSYNMYHWDGPGAIPHLKHLLNIPQPENDPVGSRRGERAPRSSPMVAVLSPDAGSGKKAVHPLLRRHRQPAGTAQGIWSEVQPVLPDDAGQQQKRGRRVAEAGGRIGFSDLFHH